MARCETKRGKKEEDVDGNEGEDESKTKRGGARRNETKETLKQSGERVCGGGREGGGIQPFGNNPQTAHNALR